MFEDDVESPLSRPKAETVEEDPKNVLEGFKKKDRLAAPFDWSALTVADLIRFHDEILQALPPTALKDMNLEKEMLLQFHALRELQTDVLRDEDVPLNQRAQVAGAVSSVLTKLSDRQIDIYRSERFKQIENLLIRELTRLPEESQKSFLDQYKLILEAFER